MGRSNRIQRLKWCNGSKAPLLILALLFLVAIAGTAYFLLSKDPNRGANDFPTGPIAATPTVPVAPAGTAGTPPDPTAGPPATTAGTPPDPTAGGTPPPTEATAGPTPDPVVEPVVEPEEDTKPTKLPPPKPDLGLVTHEGGLFTPKTPSLIFASFEKAKAHCSSLRRKKFAKLSQWKLASSGEVLKFRANTDVQKLAYWVSDPGSAGRVKRIALISGVVSEGPATDFTRTRAFCVTRR